MTEVNTALATLLSILGLWFLLVLFRDYCVDRFREDLFSLRQDLFDYAAESGVNFDDPAYGMLRSTMNGVIQFGHRLGLLEILASYFTVRKSGPSGGVFSFWSVWEKRLGTLPQQERKKLLEFHLKMHLLVVKHLLLSSPIMWLLIVVTAGFILTKSAFSKLRLQPTLNGLDSAAFRASES